MRSLPDPGFAGDDGAVDPAVAQALVAYDADPGRLHARTLAVVQSTRVLVPVTAVLGEAEQGPDGLARDKTSDMASVLMRGLDGRLALLAFTGTGPLTAWDATARPVPVSLPDAARAALQDRADALVLDVAGPVTYVVEGDDLRALAEGFTLAGVGSGGFAWVRPSGYAGS